MPASPTRTKIIVLAGNPNSGKTSLFNAMTGASQKVGNYAGVTVERASGSLRIGDTTVEVLDVPGVYSMRPASLDERIATEVLEGRMEGSRPDLVVLVVDATNLERNLFLCSQLLDSEVSVVVALTMTDVLASEGRSVDVSALEAELGCKVIPVVSFRREGIDQLVSVIGEQLSAPRSSRIELSYPGVVEMATDRLAERLALSGLDTSRDRVRRALLSEESELAASLLARPELSRALADERDTIGSSSGALRTLDTSARYAWANLVGRRTVTEASNPRRRASDRIDAVLTHRVSGLLVFVAVMYGVFQSIYTLAGPLMDGIEWGISRLQDFIRPALAGTPVFESLVVDGVVGGVGAALVFLPQIAVLFLWIAILEGSGYLARAAFLMDRLLGWCGLNGRAFIPLLSSFACAVPGIMAARVMPDERSRLATILAAPLMSCSARLPVYVLMIGAFVEPKYGPIWAGVALFGMHVVGLLVAVPLIWFLNRRVLRTPKSPFMLELPRYQWPRWRDVWLTVLSRVKAFLGTAGTIIVALSIVIWALTYFPRSADAEASYRSGYALQDEETRARVTEAHFVEERQVANSYLGQFGRALEPVFLPAGFDWRLTTAVLAAFPAREVVVSAMGILFGMGSEESEGADLRDAIARATWPDGRALVTLPTALSLMVFFALCCQCMATLAAIRRETGSWRWPVVCFVTMTLIAYIFAVATFQLGTRAGWS